MASPLHSPIPAFRQPAPAFPTGLRVALIQTKLARNFRKDRAAHRVHFKFHAAKGLLHYSSERLSSRFTVLSLPEHTLGGAPRLIIMFQIEFRRAHTHWGPLRGRPYLNAGPTFGSGLYNTVVYNTVVVGWAILHAKLCVVVL